MREGGVRSALMRSEPGPAADRPSDEAREAASSASTVPTRSGFDWLRQTLRWDDRAERRAYIAFLVLLAAAIALRVWLTWAYRPALLGFGDSYAYLLSAARDLFLDPQRPAGYPLFLRLVHEFSDKLTVTIAVQHALGLASGVLLYRAVRRVAGPPWLGLIPAAVVFFGGTELFVEHALLSEALFVFLQSLGLYMAVRALDSRRLAWPLLAGLVLGLSVAVRTVALSSAVLLPCWLAFAASGTVSRRLRSAGVALLGAAAMVGGYIGVQADSTGYTGLTRAGIWDVYSSVATIADCSKFTPPKGTEFLCPPYARPGLQSADYFEFDPSSPAVHRFGLPKDASAKANETLTRFTKAVILHQPLDLLSEWWRRMGSYVTSAQAGLGLTPELLRTSLMDRTEETAVQAAVALQYPHSLGFTRHEGAIDALTTYERHTRVDGPLIVVLLALTFAAPFLLRGRERAAAVLFGLTALLSISLAVAAHEYDARFTVPTFGPLAASAALGGWGLVARIRREIQERRAGPSARSAA
jgi:dolichyl-phosphate-mannose-protein mannosyltransferase